MKTLLSALTLCAIPVLAFAVEQQVQKKQQAKRHLSAATMQMKLVHSKDVLGGLAMGDFEAIGKGAKAMQLLTALEHWFLADTPKYKAQLNVFWYANDALVQAAEEKNLDGAALAYTQLTLSCVNCHKYVRERTTERKAKTE